MKKFILSGLMLFALALLPTNVWANGTKGGDNESIIRVSDAYFAELAKLYFGYWDRISGLETGNPLPPDEDVGDDPDAINKRIKRLEESMHAVELEVQQCNGTCAPPPSDGGFA